MDRSQGTNRKAALFVACLWLTSPGLLVSECGAETYTFDTKATEIRFTFQLGPVAESGRFGEVRGMVEFNEQTPERSRVDAVINAACLTAEPMVESELKGENFSNVALQPEIRFRKSTAE